MIRGTTVSAPGFSALCVRVCQGRNIVTVHKTVLKIEVHVRRFSPRLANVKTVLLLLMLSLALVMTSRQAVNAETLIGDGSGGLRHDGKWSKFHCRWCFQHRVRCK